MVIRSIKPPASLSFDTPKRSVLKPSGVITPRGDIVLSRRRPIVPRTRITIAGPALRPDATVVRIEAARSALRSLTEARDGFVARAAAARQPVALAPDERTRRAARAQTYRPAAAVDGDLTKTFQ